MCDFGMAETDDGLTPKMERTGHLDANFCLGAREFDGKITYPRIFQLCGKSNSR